MGRKALLIKRPELFDNLVNGIAEGHYARAVCKANGITEAIYYKWLEIGRNEKERMERTGDEKPLPDKKIYFDFFEAITRAEGQGEIRAVKALRNAFDEDWRAAAHYLERRFVNRWGRQVRQTNTNVNINANIDSANLDNLSEKELDQLEALLQKASSNSKQTNETMH